VEHRDEVDALVADWIGERSLDQVLAAFEEAEAAAAPVYSMADIAEDPHFSARGTIADVGGVAMQGLIARLSATPGRISGPAPGLGADSDEIRAELDALD
jgi:formyl-CoA transferase